MVEAKQEVAVSPPNAQAKVSASGGHLCPKG
jgi:hypothetical protein